MFRLGNCLRRSELHSDKGTTYEDLNYTQIRELPTKI